MLNSCFRLRDIEMSARHFEEKLRSTVERVERYESCQICFESYQCDGRASVTNREEPGRTRMTLKSCGHMMCSDCAYKWLSCEKLDSPSDSPSYSPEYARIVATDSPHESPVMSQLEPAMHRESGEVSSHALCPVCRTPYQQSDLVKSLIT